MFFLCSCRRLVSVPVRDRGKRAMECKRCGGSMMPETVIELRRGRPRLPGNAVPRRILCDVQNWCAGRKPPIRYTSATAVTARLRASIRGLLPTWLHADLSRSGCGHGGAIASCNPLSLARQAQQDAWMDDVSTPTSRPRPAKGASGRSRRQYRSSGGAARYRVARRVLVISGASAVFIAAFMFDTGAVARLFRACLEGHAGLRARIAAFGILLPLLCMIAFALYRPARRPPAKARNRAARPPIRNKGESERIEAIDGGPGAGTAAAKRNSRRGSNAATDRM